MINYSAEGRAYALMMVLVMLSTLAMLIAISMRYVAFVSHGVSQSLPSSSLVSELNRRARGRPIPEAESRRRKPRWPHGGGEWVHARQRTLI